MGSTQFGNFGNFCRDSTLPVCNLLTNSHDQTGGWGGCELTGIPLSGGRRLGNLGSILLCGIAIATAIYLILRSERKRAAVGRRYVDCPDGAAENGGSEGGTKQEGRGIIQTRGVPTRLPSRALPHSCPPALALYSDAASLLLQVRFTDIGPREMQLFLVGYIVISICEIFTVGEFPLSSTVRIAFTGIHIGFIIATTWMLMLNAVVGYQFIDDGTPLSLGLILTSAAVLLIGTGYIALDTGFKWTGTFDSSYDSPNYRNIALYVLYQLAPLIFLVAFYVLETVLVLRVLGETRPMVYLTLAAVLFALGQIFNYAISPHICNGTDGKIDGALFQTLFTLLSVVMVWVFWSSITEDDWPMGV